MRRPSELRGNSQIARKQPRRSGPSTSQGPGSPPRPDSFICKLRVWAKGSGLPSLPSRSPPLALAEEGDCQNARESSSCAVALRNSSGAGALKGSSDASPMGSSGDAQMGFFGAAQMGSSGAEAPRDSCGDVAPKGSACGHHGRG
eukprot:CAMPEP_0180808890 /NCGR_PEP_ID=MMETSP1038_2-20121128/64038_1 /TAXON_ID=632150 /ORGANISM="Azadinium spinosum, Strain 3D9" /LENGTH=144 /DNA_ID=CAMNT_0022850035 /DNA_START=109 /DNA_END=540 /DNA_ORIENTATION=+